MVFTIEKILLVNDWCGDVYKRQLIHSAAAAGTGADSLAPGSFCVREQAGKPFLRCGMFFDKPPVHIGDP